MLLRRSVMSLFLKAKSWVNDQNELLERKFGEWTAYPTPKRKSVVLRGPEDLEARIVPANTDLWVGPANGNFSAAANWSINGAAGVPQNGDTLQFGGSVGNVNGANTSAVDDIAGLKPGAMTINANYNQTITLSNPLTINGPLSMASGTGVTIKGTQLDITGATEAWNWGGGTISVYTTFGTPVITVGTITINGSDVTLDQVLQNYGTLNWSSKDPVNGPGPNINLTANGTLRNFGKMNIQTASTESILGQAGSSFSNSGTLQKTGVNTTKIDTNYSQARGSLTVNSGTLAFQQAFSPSGGSVVLNGGNISSVQAVTIGAPASLSGVGTFTASAGLKNSGSVIPGVNNVPGTLTLVGNYTQTSTGALVINIDSAGNYGIFNVQGSATLTGQLNVMQNPNYQPPEGTDLEFMTYTSVSGSFSTFNNGDTWTSGTGVLEFEPAPYSTHYDLIATAI